ncbi:RPL24 [Cordylochernes scorpioides]|uniref:Large ribosomal subunit protein eL24 n=1 Tax=Cordylochernes scorpioides TaxID=51811 RepID=A0ABY6KPA4_9ARAC|nr:RPL24 [Cordylochernes scorpioides]
MMKTDICSFSGYKIYPGHGKRMVKTDGKVYQFLNGKCEASHLMKKNPRKVTWTVLYRRKHKKGIEEEAAKKRTSRTTKHPESHSQREQNTRAAKEKSKAAKNQKKTTSAPVKAVKVVNKQKAVNPVQAKAIRIGGKR